MRKWQAQQVAAPSGTCGAEATNRLVSCRRQCECVALARSCEQHDYANKRSDNGRRRVVAAERRRRPIDTPSGVAASNANANVNQIVAARPKATPQPEHLSAAGEWQRDATSSSRAQDHGLDGAINYEPNYDDETLRSEQHLAAQPGDLAPGSSQATESGLEKTGKTGPAGAQSQQDAPDCAYATGERLRCNCSGRWRPNLASLVELFEWRVQVDGAGAAARASGGHNRAEGRGAAKSIRLQIGQRESERERARARNRKSNRNNNNNNNDRLHKSDTIMRDIITPVKYEPSESTTTTTDSQTDDDEAGLEPEEVERCRDDGDSLDYCCRHGVAQQPRPGARWSRPGAPINQVCCCKHERRLRSSPLERVAAKGVQVLPGAPKWRRKLTDPRWQPPTDARKYEHKLWDRMVKQQRAQSKRWYTSAGSIGRQNLTKCAPASVAATCGPPIVKHQPTNSKRLLNQLAKLRAPSEPGYRVRRPESVAKIEDLIEQLERATSEWAEDEHLLDRAERRDWPARYHEQFANNRPRPDSDRDTPAPADNRRRALQQPEPAPSPLPVGALDFGHRVDVDPIEAESIARSHSALAAADSQQGLASSAYSSLAGRQPGRRAGGLADRYHDDLAVRRLSRSPSVASERRTAASQHQASYLLCSNAYTPSIEGPTCANDSLERRLQTDDLHFRSVKPRQFAPEPPFGVPKNPGAISTCYLTAAQRLACGRPRSVGGARAPTTIMRQQHQDTLSACHHDCECIKSGDKCQTTRRLDGQDGCPASGKRTESRVSFVESIYDRTSGCVSADSGIVGAPSGSPVSDAERQSQVRRPATPISADRRQHNGGGASPLAVNRQRQPRRSESGELSAGATPDLEANSIEEVDLYGELGESADKLADWTPSESPALELVQTEVRATPSKRRPKISIENPRAKSPLLRVSNKPAPDAMGASQQKKTDDELYRTVLVQCYSDSLKRRARPTSELECQYDFHDDDDDDEEKKDPLPRTVPLAVYESSSSTANEVSSSSVDRLEDYDNKSDARREPARDPSRPTEKGAGKTGRDDKKTKKSGPNFTIGEYKPLNKPNLKIL